MIWHSNTIADVLADLQTDPDVGLSEQEAASRLKEYGKNSLQEQKPLSFRQAFMTRLCAPLTILLFIVSAAVLLLDLYKQLLQEVVTHWHLPLIVAAMAVVAALLSALRQCRAASVTASMYTLSAPDTRVRRDGAEKICSTHTLVPGDIVLLGIGDIVPADCRLIEANGLRCDECALTGATMPTEKYADTLFDDITPLAQRTNMLYAGTTITAGSAVAVVVATGVRSEMGHEQRKQPQTNMDLPMQKKMDRLNGWWSVASTIIAIVSLIIGLTRLSDRSAVLLTAVAIAVAAVPTGITALYTHLTVDSIRRLLRHRIRIRRPAVMETLGGVTVIGIEQDMLHCSGDITLRRAYVGHRAVDMTVDAPKAPGLGHLLRLAALNTTESNPTDDAILARLHPLGIEKNELLLDMPRIGELPSDGSHKTTIHLAGDETLILVGGAWRTLLPLCTQCNTEELTNAATAMEKEGLQVTAVAYRLDSVAPSVYTAEALERDLVCAGLLGIHLPLQTDASHSDERVRTILFSHESAAIAVATAQSAGLTTAPYAATAEAICRFSDEELAQAVRHYNVYCGLDATQKVRVIAALQRQGEVVAITGAHSEEAELLATADLGCAHGMQATDIAKEAADLILTEDSHGAILAAVQEGRRLRWEKIGLLVYLLLCSMAVILVGIGSFYGRFPLTYCALMLMGLHLLLLALPSPYGVISGISRCVYKLREKR